MTNASSYPTLFGCPTGGGGLVVIAGAPYDRGTDPAKAGCAAGPQTLRALSENLRIRDGALYDLASRKTMFDGRSVSDIGNLRFHPHQSDDDYLALIEQTARVIAQEGKKPFFLGGDHLITLPILRGLKASGRSFQVVQIDAHQDYAPVEPSERPTHATFVGHVEAEKLAERVIQIGVRGLAWGEPATGDTIKGVELSELPHALLPDVDVYITVDTDGFDPSVAPGVSYPEAEGLALGSLSHVLSAVRARGLNAIGADWTEYNPRFDSQNTVTGNLVLRGVANLLQHLIRSDG